MSAFRTLANLRARLGVDRDGKRVEGRGHYGLLYAMPLNAIRHSDILRCRKQLATRLDPETVNGSFKTLAQVFELARRDHRIVENPCDGLKPLPKMSRREIHPAMPEQIRIFANSLPEIYSRAVLFDYLTGLRPGELWAIKSEKIDFDRGTLRVDLTLQDDAGTLLEGWPKTRKPRTIRLDEVALDLLREQMTMFPTDTGFVFGTVEGCPVRHHNFMEDYFVPAAENLGSLLPKAFTFYDIRHSHASLLIARGHRIEQVKDRLGHGSIRTTADWYGHLFDGHDDELVADLAEVGGAIRPQEPATVASLARPKRVLPGDRAEVHTLEDAL